MFTNDIECRIQLALADIRRPAQDDRTRMLNLVQEKLSEIFRVHPALVRVNNDNRAVQLHLRIGIYILHCLHDVGKLAHTGRLDQDPLRMIRLDHFLQRTAKIAHQRAADTARIHLLDLHACLFQESAVNADLTELIFDQYNLGCIERLLQQFLDQRRLSSAQKSGKYIYFCHLEQPPR